jgi:hypothetical protein
MRLFAIALAVLLVMAVQGCAALVSPQIERDRVRAESVAQSLTCAMSPADVDRALSGKLERMSGPSENLTHIYRLQFASVWFVFRDDRLLSSQVYVIDGLTSLRPETRLDYCKP